MTEGTFTKWECSKGHKQTTALPSFEVSCGKCNKKSPKNLNLMKGVK